MSQAVLPAPRYDLMYEKACLPKYITTHTRPLLHVQIILSKLHLCQRMQMAHETAEAKAPALTALRRKFLKPGVLGTGG